MLHFIHRYQWSRCRLPESPLAGGEPTWRSRTFMLRTCTHSEFPCMDNMWSTNNGEWTGIGATIQEGKNGGSRFLCTETFLCQAVLYNLEPLMSALISDSSTDPTAKGILVFITTFSFLATTHLLADILLLLARLSKSVQRQCMDFSSVNECLQATIQGFKIHLGQLSSVRNNHS